jgi:hypothetical protein
LFFLEEKSPNESADDKPAKNPAGDGIALHLPSPADDEFVEDSQPPHAADLTQNPDSPSYSERLAADNTARGALYSSVSSGEEPHAGDGFMHDDAQNGMY